MASGFLIEGLLILVLIVANGIFSGAEIAVVSARKVRLEHQAERGDRRARAALRLAAAPNDFLSTVQIGITLIGILSGAVGGATIARRLEPLLAGVPGIGGSAEGLSVVLVVGVITYLSLVIGELVPKRVALSDPESIACAVAGPMRSLSRLCAPVVHLLGQSTDALLRLLGVAASGEPDLTEDEIKALIRQGAEAGVFEQAEHSMVQRVFRLGDRPIRAFMTPRTEITWLDAEASPEEQLETVIESSHARLPVGAGSLDACEGVLRTSQFLVAERLARSRRQQEAVPGQELPAPAGLQLATLLQPPLYVAETMRALAVIERFRESGSHIALVTDEFGGVAGLVTVTDLMEAIVGDLPSAEDAEDPSVVRRDDGTWLIDGMLEIDSFRELVESTGLSGESSGDFHTVGGFAMHRLGRIPRTGELFEADGLRFEIVDMDGNRVDKLLVSRIAADPTGQNGSDPEP
ncbi:MAG: hemolysin family protein [Cyanobacteriota bacterium]|nr:hemolysin family protein [Cyanobacteriota bacterium]